MTHKKFSELIVSDRMMMAAKVWVGVAIPLAIVGFSLSLAGARTASDIAALALLILFCVPIGAIVIWLFIRPFFNWRS